MRKSAHFFDNDAKRPPADNLDAVLAALGEPTRRRALRLLHTKDELCVCELMAELGVSQSRMSRHMSTLKAAGLVLDRRDAQWVRYRRNPFVPTELAVVVTSILAAEAATRTSRRARTSPRNKETGPSYDGSKLR